MKRIVSIILCLVFLTSFVVPALAASDVPEEVMEATKSVVRIYSEYYYTTVTGSGFVIKNEPGDVLIVTNHHVVEGNPKRVCVWVSEDKLVEAQIVFAVSQKDLCVLRLTEDVDMAPLTLSQEDARHGSAIYVVGYPGAGDVLSDTEAHTSESATITDGIISAIRTFTIEEGASPVKLLQVNAAVNFGNSGGPLFNSKGEVIGVNTYKVTADSQGIFGAVDIGELWSLLEQYDIVLVEETEPVTETIVVEEPVPEELPFPMIAVIGICVAVVLAVVLLVLSKKKKKAVSLREYMKKYPNGMGVSGAVSLLLPVAIYLRDLHNHGRLHLQVSPESILVSSKGVALKEASKSETDRHCSGFAAPEIYKGAGFGVASDIYSFSAVLYYVATGNIPANSLQNELLEDTFSQFEEQEPVFGAMIRKSMAFLSQDRTQSMQELIYGISAFSVQLTKPVAEQTVEIPQPEKTEVKKQGNKKILVTAIVVCVILAVTLLWRPLLRPGFTYLKAVSLMNNEQYEEAIVKFSELEEFMDSVKKLEEATAGLTEQQYNLAVSLMNEGKFEEALAIFTTLSDYKDSLLYMQNCQAEVDIMLYGAGYAEAEAFENAGEFGKAAIAFGKLGDYKDSRERSMAMWKHVPGRNMIIQADNALFAIRLDGTVACDSASESTTAFCNDTSVCKDIVSIAGLAFLRNDGTVALCADDFSESMYEEISSWTDIVALASGESGISYMGLKSDGTVVVACSDPYIDCGVEGWSDIISIACSDSHFLAARADGTVVACGKNNYGQCDVSGWTNIKEVAVGGFTPGSFGLRYDGTVIGTGDDYYGQPGKASLWKNIETLKYGPTGIRADGTAITAMPSIYNGGDFVHIINWTDIVDVYPGYEIRIGLKSDGTLVFSEVLYEWYNEGRTWTRLMVP